MCFIAPATAQRRVYTAVETMPGFPGGEEALANYLTSNLRLSQDSLKDAELHSVFLSFIVEKNGSITGVKPVNPRNTYIERVAIHLVEKMPAWEPARHKGKKVAVHMTIPIRICFQE
ncbi:energy transducer TonB [Chitinophaga lutea]|nr:energy transducer TonB [Chitinophaga lutea]